MIAFLLGLAVAATAPAAVDPDTRAWWRITATLSSDRMEGRDTGSAAYHRAARLVAARFAAAGLKPLGDKGGWFQRVEMAQLSVDSAAISAGGRPLAFLSEITVAPAEGMPARLDAPLAYRG
jgi:hypothetical protein